MSASRFRRCDGGRGLASRSAASDASVRSSGAPESPVGANNAPASGSLRRGGRRSRNSTGDEAGAAAMGKGAGDRSGLHS